ncbi:hypothetical protein HU762_07035 [Pseudomonas sp. SWRI92]|uniref:hypothetical protein n=1 Tax=Pseudomonas sp. SWRI92 TaxID=2745499 RepID=UPI0016489603|nr:hypothetical protein [Pseudomonas sp. SWRI92]MBC3373694.1 hypothetical protein [Pseudomonas sp. SWRI92]
MTDDNEKTKRPLPMVGQVELIEIIEERPQSPQIFKKVGAHLLRDPEDYGYHSAGYIAGFMQNSAQGGKSAESNIYIGFPVLDCRADKLEKYSYPSDFLSGPSLGWFYIDQDGQEHRVTTGEIALKVGLHFYSYDGTFSFTDRDDKTFKGSFNLKLSVPGSK